MECLYNGMYDLLGPRARVWKLGELRALRNGEDVGIGGNVVMGQGKREREFNPLTEPDYSNLDEEESYRWHLQSVDGRCILGLCDEDTKRLNVKSLVLSLSCEDSGEKLIFEFEQGCSRGDYTINYIIKGLLFKGQTCSLQLKRVKGECFLLSSSLVDEDGEIKKERTRWTIKCGSDYRETDGSSVRQAIVITPEGGQIRVRKTPDGKVGLRVIERIHRDRAERGFIDIDHLERFLDPKYVFQTALFTPQVFGRLVTFG